MVIKSIKIKGHLDFNKLNWKERLELIFLIITGSKTPFKKVHHEK